MTLSPLAIAGWFLRFLLAALLVTPAHAADAPPGPAADATRIEAFVREGCPHCAKAEEFLAQLQKERPALSIVIRDVQKEPAALERLKELAQQTNTGTVRVPAIHVRGQLIVGFSPEASTDALIRSALDGRQAGPQADAAGTCDAEESLACPKGPDAAAEEEFSITLFGRTITLADVGLPAFTLTMGLLDGFNPCSMWVLLLMISLLAPMNDRKRMIAIGGTFVLIAGHRLLRVHGGLAEHVPADRDVARGDAGGRGDRDRRGPDQPEGLRRVRPRHLAVDPGRAPSRASTTACGGCCTHRR